MKIAQLLMFFWLYESMTSYAMNLTNSIDMTPIPFPQGRLPGLNNISKKVEIYEMPTNYDSGIKLTAILPEPSIFDLLEEQSKEENMQGDFTYLKDRRLAKLQQWINALPYTFNEPEMYSQGYTGKTPQTNYNTSFFDRLGNGVFEDSRKPVDSTLEKAFRPQCLLKIINPETNQTISRSSAFLFRENAALTAAHCVYDNGKRELNEDGTVKITPATGWKQEKIIVYPAYNNGQVPLKGYIPKQIFIPQAWINAEYFNNRESAKYYGDFAVLIFDENIADLTGSLGLSALVNTAPYSEHPLYRHIAHTGGYPGSIGAVGIDKIGKNAKKQGFSITNPIYLGSLYNIQKINNGRLIKHHMDVTPGQSGAPILPHYPNVLNFLEEPYAMGITSHGNCEINKGLLITPDILRWALNVSNPYQIVGKESLYHLTIPQLLDRIKYHVAQEDEILATNPNSPLKAYREKWPSVLAKIAMQCARLDPHHALSIHQYNFEKFLSTVSGHYIAKHYEEANNFLQAREIYQEIYNRLLSIYKIQEYKYSRNMEKLPDISNEFKESLLRLGCYYLHGVPHINSHVLGENYNLQKAYWLFYLSKISGHEKANTTLTAFLDVLNTKNLSFFQMYTNFSFQTSSNLENIFTPKFLCLENLVQIERFWRHYFCYWDTPIEFSLRDYIIQHPQEFNPTVNAKWDNLYALTNIINLDGANQ